MFYYKAVKHLRTENTSPALDIGILAHECLAAHYATGGVRTWEPIQAIEQELPEVANEVKRLLYAYFATYLKEDAETWDIRTVEQEIVGEVEHAGNKAQVYSRSDLLIRKKQPGEPSLPFGPCPDGVYIVDHKFMARMSKDLTDGYRMDGQFLLMAYLWHQQKLDDVFGPLKGFIINIVTKTKDIKLLRLTVNVAQEDIDRFIATMGPEIIEMHQKLIQERAEPNMENWKMNFGACKNPKGYGPCEFFELCASHGKLEHLYMISSKK